MSAPRPDRCLTVLLPGDDPDAAAENPDLNEALHAGRPVIAFWQGDAGGRTKIVVVFGPVPVPLKVPSPVPVSLHGLRGPLLVLAVSVAVVALVVTRLLAG